jgi:hypothetical protein
VASADTTEAGAAIPVMISWSVTSAGGTELDLRAPGQQPASQPPDAPSAVQAASVWNAAKPGFEDHAGCDMPVVTQRSYDQTTGASDPGKLIRMISGIVRRFDQPDVAVAPGAHENPGLSGDTTFAVSRRLALIGAYQHNSVPSFDTMAFGLAFNFGGNTNQSSSR